MTKEFETLLYLFGDSSLGRKSRITSVENPDKIIDMAVKQGIWSCVYPILNEICDVKKYYFDFLAFVSKSISKNEFTLKIISEAMKSGINVRILKGVAVASLYANPDYRVSSDTDILIKKEDERKVKKLLMSKGYDVKTRKNNEHHITAIHPVGGLLEVHISLNDELFDKFAFNLKYDYSEQTEKITIGGADFYTLGINDNLLFLTEHYIRHFIGGGSSIRQMMDLLLYIKKYEQLIDFKKYNKILEELKYDKLIQAVKAVGVKYFGMDFELINEDVLNMLLTDCENCGIFGSANKHATNVSAKFYESRKITSALNLKLWRLFKAENSVFKRIFPSQKVLLKMGYSYVKYKCLIPLAWFHKVFDFVFKRNKVRNERINEDILNARIETMRRLSMFD